MLQLMKVIPIPNDNDVWTDEALQYTDRTFKTQADLDRDMREQPHSYEPNAGYVLHEQRPIRVLRPVPEQFVLGDYNEAKTE